MYQYFDTLTDDSGNALLGATLTVTKYPSGAAPIYLTNGTAQPIASSTVAADITGQVSFFIPDGSYIFTYVYKGTTYKVRSPVQTLDPMGFVAITDSGSTNALAVVDSRLPASLYTGLKVEVQALSNNTGAATLNFQGLGPQPIVQPGGSAIVPGMIQTSGLFRFEWDGIEWQLLGAQSQPFYAITPAEQAASVTIINSSIYPGDPRRYGAKLDGVTNDTAAWVAAISMGQPLLSNCFGTTIVDTIFFPNRPGPTPTFTAGFRFVGPGLGLLIFQAASANERVFAKVASNSELDGGVFGGFSIKAHAAGSTTTAFDVSGFRFCAFNDIAGLSNGTKGFFSLFSVSAYPYLCYNNVWNRPQFNGVAGWTKMFDFNNGGTATAGNNSNVGTINDILCYASGGMTVVVDGYRSAKINMKGGLIEANTGADAIWPGQAWKISDIWMESNNTPAIVPGSPESGSATVNSMVESCYFSQSQTVNFPSGCTGNLWIGNQVAGTITFTGDTSNFLIQLGVAPPAAPTFSAAAGTLVLVSANATTPQDLLQQTTYELIYTYTPAATGPVALTYTAPASGFTYRTISASIIRGGNGDPKAVGVDTINSKIWANYTSTDSHNVLVYFTIATNYG